MNNDLQREYDVTLRMQLDNGDPARAEAVVCDWLAERRQIGPIPYLIDLDGEAAIWVASVSPVEKLAYLGAILKDMAQTGFHLNVRKQMSDWLWHGYALPDQKRLHMAQWTSFSDADHKAFLARVDSSEAAA